MGGILSLVNDFSISCVFEGRVSLAHLMEFSHFVDLYVLEDDIYIHEAAKSVNLSELDGDPDNPLRPYRLTEFHGLAAAASDVADYTGSLYDYAPVNYTFSMGAYDYWTTLSPRERESVAHPAEVGIEGHRQGRPALLAYSHALHRNIERALEELGKTTLTIMPSSRNLLPFLHVFHQMDTPALKLYNEVSEPHRKAVEDILALTRPRAVYLPPLLSVLLARCEKRADIPRRLIELRAEFADLRRSIKEWFEQLDGAGSIKEKIEVRDELDEAVSSLARHYEQKRAGFYKQVTGAFISAAEDGDLKKMLVKPAIEVLKEGVSNMLPDMLSVRRFTGLIDLMDEALNVENYSAILTRVFGERLDISQKEITEAKRYKQYLQTKYDLGLQLPS